MPGQEIQKLNFMRQLRKRSGAKFSQNLFMSLDKLVYDTSHFTGACTITKFLAKRKALRQKRRQRFNRLSRLMSFDASHNVGSFAASNARPSISSPKSSNFSAELDKIAPKLTLGYRNQSRTQTK